MIDYQLIKDKLLISYYDKNGKIAYTKITIPPNQYYKWKLDPNGKHKNQDGNGISKVRGSINRHRINEILNELPEEMKAKINSLARPKITFCDIETEVLEEGFPDVNDPMGRVLTNAFCSAGDRKIYVQTLKPLSGQEVKWVEDNINKDLERFGVKYKLVHLKYDDEKTMLRHFLCKLVPQMHAISGWNFIKFDWAYLMGRAKKLGIDVKATSVTKTMDMVVIKDKFDKSKVIKTIVPKHRPVIDYMTIWEKWDTSVKIKSSSSLDVVAELALGIRKVKYDGTLTSLYNNNFPRFVYYNAIDTILVEFIHHELSTMGTMIALSMESFTPLNSALYASQILEPMFQAEYLKDGYHLVVDYDKLNKQQETGEKYVGGYVREPDKGNKGGVSIMDFESLFPSLVMLINIGIDTYVGETEGCEDGFFKDHDGNIVELDFSKYALSSMGAVFTKDHISVASRVIWRLFGGRIANKSHANDVESELNYLKQMLEEMKP